MSAALHISIPQTSVANDSSGKPYTLYHITLQLPLRKQETRKRYTDFVSLHNEITSQASAPPPSALPPKNWLRRTVDNSALTEQRRSSLEKYIQAIMNNDDSRWRSSAAWRAFLDLPSGTSTIDEHGNLKSSKEKKTQELSSGEWLDIHRELKNRIQHTRSQLKQRETAVAPQQQHSLSADAKSNLVRAATIIAQLDQSLSAHASSSTSGLGDGEIRRRRDLLVSAKKEIQALEGVLKSIASRPQRVEQPSAPLKEELWKGTPTAKPGRVLGGPAQETKRTQELDNNGVLQLQQQIMKEQDEDVLLLGSTINRLKDMGIMMNEELTIQNQMLDLIEGDVDRVQGKINVGRKRIQHIK